MLEMDIMMIEDIILQEIEKLRDLPGIVPDAKIDKDCIPELIGIRSIVLVTITGYLEDVLGIEIPANCYIFRDTDGLRELNIREAAEKLRHIATPWKTT